MSLHTGSIATHTQLGERDRHLIACRSLVGSVSKTRATARILPQPTRPWYEQWAWGQKWPLVSTCRRRPRVNVMRGGGAWGAEAEGCTPASCSQAEQSGLWVR